MDLTALDNWASISRAVVAVCVLLSVAKLVGGGVVGRDRSIHLQLIAGMNCVGLLGLALWLGASADSDAAYNRGSISLRSVLNRAECPHSIA